VVEGCSFVVTAEVNGAQRANYLPILHEDGNDLWITSAMTVQVPITGIYRVRTSKKRLGVADYYDLHRHAAAENSIACRRRFREDFGTSKEFLLDGPSSHLSGAVVAAAAWPEAVEPEDLALKGFPARWAGPAEVLVTGYEPCPAPNSAEDDN